MRVDIKGAVKHTGLTEYAIRQGVKKRIFPVYRVGSGKLIFDTDLLDDAIRNEMMKSVNKYEEEPGCQT